VAEATKAVEKGEEKSERLVVPTKPGNRPEGLGGGKGTPDRGTAQGKEGQHSMLETVSTKQARIAELAGRLRDKPLLTIAQHMDLDWLAEAHRRTRKDGATGIDGQTAATFEAKLGENLRSLLDRAKSGLYRAPPVRRVHIPKGDGSKTRPIGIPTYEDKVLQRAVVMLLEPVYEREFYDFSYGFRPQRSAHDALEALQKGLIEMRGGWVLDVDIQSFFDTLDHEKLRDLLRQRVADGVVTRLVGKWLRAGVLEGGVVRRADQGTPQGGVISPLLANIYLHEVLDKWWAEMVPPSLDGRAFMVRYADDFVMVFSERRDAERVLGALPKRFARFGLTLHPDKTRLLRFLPPNPRDGEPGTFDFLGFTHYLGKTRKGNWFPFRQTSRKRLTRALKLVRKWMRTHRHLPVAKQAAVLGQKLRGHFAYYGIRGNSRALTGMRYVVVCMWKKWLSRRSQRGHLTWDAFKRLLARYPLPPARLRSGWEQLRLANL
jgi:group II intron reverse transcriptase/maturase